MVPLVLSFFRPCANIANSFEQPLIKFLPSDPVINFLYSRIFMVAESGTAFILRRGFVDGSEARLISCWDRCCHLEGRFIVVKASSVLSRE